MSKSGETKTKAKNKGGRPNEVNAKIESNIENIKKYYRFGLTDKQVADILEIGESSLNRYKDENKQFWETLKNEKGKADLEVVASLYKKAIGYEYEEIEQEGQPSIDPVTKKETIKIKTVRKKRKYVPPDTLSIIYWLRNRQGWQDKQREEKPIDNEPLLPEFDNMTDDQLDNYILQHSK